MLELEKLLKKTRFKPDATGIARKLAKAGLTLATFSDAPSKLGYYIWGKISTYEIISAIHEALNAPDETEAKKAPELKTKTLPVYDKPAESEE